jgi:c-di-AMP phosphodiesterase-like protein
MTTGNKQELLRLYKLLWEQIKDMKRLEMNDIFYEAQMLDLSREEVSIIASHILDNYEDKSDPFSETGLRKSKSFVQRMITELETEIK